MVQEVDGCTRGKQKLDKPVAMINQTIFSNYHRFGTSATMIFNEAESQRVTPENAPGQAAVSGDKATPATVAPIGQSRRP